VTSTHTVPNIVPLNGLGNRVVLRIKLVARDDLEKIMEKYLPSSIKIDIEGK